MAIVYKYMNKINGKSYIGVTSNPEKRKIQHKYTNGSSPAFHNAIKKYGWDKFTYEILEEVETLEDAYTIESYYIEINNSIVPHGYNINDGGEGGQTKLTSDDIDEIIELHFEYGIPMNSLADKYKCHRTTIQSAIHNRGLIGRTGLPETIYIGD